MITEDLYKPLTKPEQMASYFFAYNLLVDVPTYIFLCAGYYAYFNKFPKYFRDTYSMETGKQMYDDNVFEQLYNKIGNLGIKEYEHNRYVLLFRFIYNSQIQLRSQMDKNFFDANRINDVKSWLAATYTQGINKANVEKFTNDKSLRFGEVTAINSIMRITGLSQKIRDSGLYN